MATQKFRLLSLSLLLTINGIGSQEVAGGISSPETTLIGTSCIKKHELRGYKPPPIVFGESTETETEETTSALNGDSEA